MWNVRKGARGFKSNDKREIILLLQHFKNAIDMCNISCLRNLRIFFLLCACVLCSAEFDERDDNERCLGVEENATVPTIASQNRDFAATNSLAEVAPTSDAHDFVGEMEKCLNDMVIVASLNSKALTSFFVTRENTGGVDGKKAASLLGTEPRMLKKGFRLEQHLLTPEKMGMMNLQTVHLLERFKEDQQQWYRGTCRLAQLSGELKEQITNLPNQESQTGSLSASSALEQNLAIVKGISRQCQEMTENLYSAAGRKEILKTPEARGLSQSLCAEVDREVLSDKQGEMVSQEEGMLPSESFDVNRERDHSYCDTEEERVAEGDEEGAKETDSNVEEGEDQGADSYDTDEEARKESSVAHSAENADECARLCERPDIPLLDNQGEMVSQEEGVLPSGSFHNREWRYSSCDADASDSDLIISDDDDACITQLSVVTRQLFSEVSKQLSILKRKKTGRLHVDAQKKIDRDAGVHCGADFEVHSDSDNASTDSDEWRPPGSQLSVKKMKTISKLDKKGKKTPQKALARHQRDYKKKRQLYVKHKEKLLALEDKRNSLSSLTDPEKRECANLKLEDLKYRLLDERNNWNKCVDRFKKLCTGDSQQRTEAVERFEAQWQNRKELTNKNRSIIHLIASIQRQYYLCPQDIEELKGLRVQRNNIIQEMREASIKQIESSQRALQTRRSQKVCTKDCAVEKDQICEIEDSGRVPPSLSLDVAQKSLSPDQGILMLASVLPCRTGTEIPSIDDCLDVLISYVSKVRASLVPRLMSGENMTESEDGVHARESALTATSVLCNIPSEVNRDGDHASTISDSDEAWWCSARKRRRRS